jgi:hypothetical protein
VALPRQRQARASDQRGQSRRLAPGAFARAVPPPRDRVLIGRISQGTTGHHALAPGGGMRGFQRIAQQAHQHQVTPR